VSIHVFHLQIYQMGPIIIYYLGIGTRCFQRNLILVHISLIISVLHESQIIFYQFSQKVAHHTKIAKLHKI